MDKYCSVLVVLLTLIGCSSHVKGPRVAVADLEGSAAAGMSYLDFGHKLQNLGAAIALSRQEGGSERQLRPFVEAFEMYKDSQTLWGLKIDCPELFQVGNFSCSGTFSLHLVSEMAKKYGVPYPQISRPDPSDGQDTYNNELRSANGQVFDNLLRSIWNAAAQKSKE